MVQQCFDCKKSKNFDAIKEKVFKKIQANYEEKRENDD